MSKTSVQAPKTTARLRLRQLALVIHIVPQSLIQSLKTTIRLRPRHSALVVRLVPQLQIPRPQVTMSAAHCVSLGQGPKPPKPQSSFHLSLLDVKPKKTARTSCMTLLTSSFQISFPPRTRTTSPHSAVVTSKRPCLLLTASLMTRALLRIHVHTSLMQTTKPSVVADRSPMLRFLTATISILLMTETSLNAHETRTLSVSDLVQIRMSSALQSLSVTTCASQASH